jgi:hypothetical protein
VRHASVGAPERGKERKAEEGRRGCLTAPELATNCGGTAGSGGQLLQPDGGSRTEKKGEERGVRGLLIAGFGGRLAHGKERGEWS